MRIYTRLSLAERFWPKVDRRGPDECWDWQGARTGFDSDSCRYGYLGRTPASGSGPEVSAMRAHVASWTVHHGPIAPGRGVCVLHRCDRPICVNPNHLFLGSIADNNRDRSAKGRTSRRWAGMGNPTAKVTDEHAERIVADYRSGLSQIRVAALHGISQPQVSRIVRGIRHG